MVTDSLRLFFALWPPREVAEALHQLAGKARADGGGRVMRKEGLHLTLAFLGMVARSRLEALETIAATVHAESFTLSLDRLDYWPHNHILWAGCASPAAELSTLAESMRSRLTEAGFPLQPPSFTPHVTLVRNANPPKQLCSMAPIPWPVADFALVESRGGGDYQALRHWPLRPQ